MRSGHELRLLKPSFLTADGLEDHGGLVEDFAEYAEAIADVTQGEDIVIKVFLGP